MIAPSYGSTHPLILLLLIAEPHHSNPDPEHNDWVGAPSCSLPPRLYGRKKEEMACRFHVQIENITRRKALTTWLCFRNVSSSNCNLLFVELPRPNIPVTFTVGGWSEFWAHRSPKWSNSPLWPLLIFFSQVIFYCYFASMRLPHSCVPTTVLLFPFFLVNWLFLPCLVDRSLFHSYRLWIFPCL